MANPELEQIIDEQILEIVKGKNFTRGTSQTVERYIENQAFIERAREAILRVPTVARRVGMSIPMGDFGIGFTFDGLSYDTTYTKLVTPGCIEETLVIAVLGKNYSERSTFVNRHYEDGRLHSDISYELGGDLLSVDPKVNQREALRMIEELELSSGY